MKKPNLTDYDTGDECGIDFDAYLDATYNYESEQRDMQIEQEMEEKDAVQSQKKTDTQRT